MRRQLAVALLRRTNAELWRQFQLASTNQWLAAADLQALHEQRLAETLRHAVAKVPFYREWAGARGRGSDSLGHADLAAFPLVDKAILTERHASFLADDCPPGDRLTAETGGSSGVWFSFRFDRRTKEVRRAGDFLGRTWAGWRVGEPMALIWGHRGDVKAAATTRSRLANALVHRRTTLNAYDMDDAAIARYVDLLRRERPSVILGYATSLAFVGEHLGRRGITDIRPRGILSSAETLMPEQRELITRQFGCPVLNRYGSREFANIAQQCGELGGLHIFADRIHVEVLRPDGTACEPGERGEIVVTDLVNGAMPFIRYRTGDLGVMATEPCACGRGMPMLASVEGRVSEIICGPNGKYYSCQSPRLFGADIPGIAQMQVIQEAITSIEVRIVPGPGWAESSRAMLVERMRGLLGEIEVTVTAVDSIPPAPSGKYRFTISKVSPFAARGVETR